MDVTKWAFISFEGFPNYLNHFEIAQFVVNAVALITFDVHPKMMKSSSSEIATLITYGWQTMARELPPNYESLA